MSVTVKSKFNILFFSDDFNKTKSQLDRNLEDLQLHLNESCRFLSSQLKEDCNTLNLKKLESNVYKIVDGKVSVSKQEQLRVTVDYLLESNQRLEEKYEMLKTCIDWVFANNLSANKLQNEVINILQKIS